MKKALLSFLVLGLLAGVASADRGRGRWKRHNHRHHATWSGGVVVSAQPRPVYQPRRVYVDQTRVVRRPIYVQRPVIQYRYYNYAQRPALIAETYPSMEGYYWVSGQWSWNGYEWMWTPGHYEPDPNYGYSSGYSSGYSTDYTGDYYDGY